MNDFFKKNNQLIINIVLFVSLTRFFAIQALESYQSGEFGLLEIIWVIHNLILVSLILIRKNHLFLQTNFLHQGIALLAFFSGAFMDLKVKAPEPWCLTVSNGILLVTVIAGTITLINLGKSFGILIAVREVKSNGLYAFVRHPMYGTDILMRLGIIFRHPSWFNFIVALFSTLCYVQRAILEEHFLSQFPEYKEYMERVRYRFIPGLF
ncbi:MAG: hypothetical protein HQM08_18950 [Candidatus Riflebacteria bacterium]|nr:hypothetical protein [Candidatus Riflebacteria bacterium]